MSDIIQTGATISPDQLFRYNLWRIWDTAKPYALFVGLNPSTADATEDDPTIRRCKRFAADWGYGGIHMVNLFAYRATKPENMMKAYGPHGADNDQWIKALTEHAGIIICAWGANGDYLNRDQEVIELLESFDLYHLGMTKDGKPRHPLYIKADTKPIPFQIINNRISVWLSEESGND